MREIDLAFIKLHILYHAAKEEVYGVGLIEELGRHGYKLSPGTLYPTLAKLLVQDFLERSETGTVRVAEVLTPREREVVTYIAEGYTNREIAEALTISHKTVDRHRENIMRKLNLHNRVELVKYAIEKGLIIIG